METNKKFSLKSEDYIHTPEGKKTFNEEHFHEAARHYDFATRAMSLGRDMAWKRHLVKTLPEIDSPICVDLACGTGDIAFMLADKFPRGKVIGIDLTEAMLEVARRRNSSPKVDFIRGDMSDLELAAEYADIVTGSYAVRNAPDLKKAFGEINRILKPGGTAALLDFSKPPRRWFQRLQYHVLKNWCGFWGLVLHGNPQVHSYIAASLKGYPDRDTLYELVRESGFRIHLTRRFYFGTLEIIVLEKPAR